MEPAGGPMAVPLAVGCCRPPARRLGPPAACHAPVPDQEAPARPRSRSRSQGGGGGGFDDRHRFLVTDPEAAAASMAAQMQQQQMLALQQQELQKQLLAQQMMMGPGGLAAAAAVPGATQAQQLETVHRKQREIYIGNLAMGIITQDLLREFWDQVGGWVGVGVGGSGRKKGQSMGARRLQLHGCCQRSARTRSTPAPLPTQVFAHTVPDPVADPPVVNVNMDGQGRFAFVEFQTHELATKALEMDHVVCPPACLPACPPACLRQATAGGVVSGLPLTVPCPVRYAARERQPCRCERSGLPPLPAGGDLRARDAHRAAQGLHRARAGRGGAVCQQAAERAGGGAAAAAGGGGRAACHRDTAALKPAAGGAAARRGGAARGAQGSGQLLPPGGGGGAPGPRAALPWSSPLPAPACRPMQLQGEVHEEASKYGAVEGVYVAAPTAHVQDLMPGRAYVKYGSTKDATTGAWQVAGAGSGRACMSGCNTGCSTGMCAAKGVAPALLAGKAVFDGRTLDGNTVKAVFVTEEEYARAASGEWVVRQRWVGQGAQRMGGLAHPIIRSALLLLMCMAPAVRSGVRLNQRVTCPSAPPSLAAAAWRVCRCLGCTI